MLKLDGKVALVTGGSRGIGAAIAQRLAADGAAVAVNYSRGAEAANSVVESITRAGGRAIAVQSDLTDLDSIPRMIDSLVREFGQLDILVNNAGRGDQQITLDQTSPRHVADLFDLNVRGLIFTTQAAARTMNDGGRVINISSGIVKRGQEGSSIYTATKAAVEALTRAWARELGKRQITVNVVAPGPVETDMLRQVLPPERIKSFQQLIALGRLGQPKDIADVVAFVASDDSRWITGQVIGADGGMP